jgi:hypothetical protein
MTDIIPVDPEFQQLPQTIQAWKEVAERSKRLREELKETMKRQKVLEASILATMTKHNIGALDLKSSGGRLLSKKKQSKGALSQKAFHAAAAEFLKNEDQANNLLAFVAEKRGTTSKTVLTYEKL